jgi:hypothetical protein
VGLSLLQTKTHFYFSLLRPAGHPQNGLKFWLVGWSVGRLVGQLVGHGEVTQTSCCLFSFVTRARPSRPFYALQATPKTALNLGWLVVVVVASISQIEVWGNGGNTRAVGKRWQSLQENSHFSRLLPEIHLHEISHMSWAVEEVSRSVGGDVTLRTNVIVDAVNFLR